MPSLTTSGERTRKEDLAKALRTQRKTFLFLLYVLCGCARNDRHRALRFCAKRMSRVWQDPRAGEERHVAAFRLHEYARPGPTRVQRSLASRASKDGHTGAVRPPVQGQRREPWRPPAQSAATRDRGNFGCQRHSPISCYHAICGRDGSAIIPFLDTNEPQSSIRALRAFLEPQRRHSTGQRHGYQRAQILMLGAWVE
jgi:hypothetical protein